MENKFFYKFPFLLLTKKRNKNIDFYFFQNKMEMKTFYCVVHTLLLPPKTTDFNLDKNTLNRSRHQKDKCICFNSEYISSKLINLSNYLGDSLTFQNVYSNFTNPLNNTQMSYVYGHIHYIFILTSPQKCSATPIVQQDRKP